MSLGANKASLMGAAGGAAAAGFYTHQIANSCRFDGSSSELDRTPGSAGNRRTFTFSTWIKKVKNGAQQCFFSAGGGWSDFEFDSSDRLHGHLVSGGTSFQSTAKLRDPSAWQNFVVIMDTTQGTADDRCKVYINGERITAWNTDPASTISQDYDWDFNNSVKHAIGYEHSGRRYFGGYLAETYMVDGTAQAIGDCGETKNGVWIPKDPSGFTFGTNGFLLNYADATDLGNDVSGNNNDFTSSGLAASDQMLDSPTFSSDDGNGGNFATLNPLGAGSYNALSEGNLRNTGNSGGPNGAPSTMGARSGQWYWEVRITTLNESHPTVGISAGSLSNATSPTTGDIANLLKYTGDTAGLVQMSMTNDVWGTYGETETGLTAYSAGDICMLALDIDNKKLWYGKNGTWFNSGDPAAGTNPQQTWTGTGFDIFPVVGSYSTNTVAEANFGADGTFNGTETAQGNSDATGYGDFYYTPPSGFLALCSGNLPTPAADPADDDGPGKYFNTVTYTGTGSSEGITGVGFQPDVVLIKNRGESDDWNHQNDVLGVAKTQAWNTDAAVADETDCIDSFDSDGFTVDSDDKVNASSETYVAYCWKESADAGFDIYTYSGTGSAVTVSHSLGVVPDLILNFLNTGSAWDSTSYWNTSSMGTGKGLFMPLTNAAQSTTYVDSTSTTNFVTTNMSASGRTYFGYAIANKEGLVKVGEYEGNADNDGTFVYTGFRPAFILIKSIDGARHWGIHDNKRSPYNVSINQLDPDANYAAYDSTGRARDFLSNGFKLITSDADVNGSETYVYLAFAKNPFKYATAR